MRDYAAVGLGLLGDASAREQLTALLERVAPDVRLLAAEALARLGDTTALQMVTPFLESDQPMERIMAATDSPARTRKRHSRRSPGRSAMPTRKCDGRRPWRSARGRSATRQRCEDCCGTPTHRSASRCARTSPRGRCSPPLNLPEAGADGHRTARRTDDCPHQHLAAPAHPPVTASLCQDWRYCAICVSRAATGSNGGWLRDLERRNGQPVVTVLLLGHAYVGPVAASTAVSARSLLAVLQGTWAGARTIVTSRTGPMPSIALSSLRCSVFLRCISSTRSPRPSAGGRHGVMGQVGRRLGRAHLQRQLHFRRVSSTGAAHRVGHVQVDRRIRRGVAPGNIAVHGLHVLFGAWYLAAMFGSGRVRHAPSPFVLAGFGSLHFRDTATGTVDVLVAALSANALALYLGLARRSWRTRGYDFAVLGAALFAALCTKLTGIVTVVLVVAFHAARVRGTAVDRSHRPQLSQTLRRGLAIAGLSLAPFIVEQAMGELRVYTLAQSPFEVNISVRSMPGLLASDAEVVYRGEKMTARPQLVQLRFWNNYDVPATLRIVFTIALVVWLAAAIPTRSDAQRCRSSSATV